MRSIVLTAFSAVFFMVGVSSLANGQSLNFAQEELVQADGIDIEVPGYSVPSFVDWNNDDLKDLVIGQGSGAFSPAKVRVYLNVGTESDPQFSDYFFAQSGNSDLTVPASGCLGCFPRIVDWNGDDRKDLLIGLANGTIKIFLNIDTNENPRFDAGSTLQVGILILQRDLDVGSRATPAFLDWDNDGLKDLVVGALDGRIHIYQNCGCEHPVPAFYYEPAEGSFVRENGSILIVPQLRSSPVVFDFDGDGSKDLLTGDTEGQILFYRNVGTDANPAFSGYSLVQSDGAAINLPDSPRSRPFVCYWTGDGIFGPIDGYPDLLVGAGDGRVHLYRGIPRAGDMNVDGAIDFEDFALFATYWQQTECGQCGGADFTGDEAVDFNDLRELAANWLIGT